MEDELLSLKWSNHKNTFFENLKILREKSNHTDATLAVGGKFYSVHKLVMSTCSEYFSDLFERTPCKSPVIVLKDVRSHDIEALLDYMYLGEVNVNQSDLASLLKAAECLRIKGLGVSDEDPAISHKNLTSSYDDSLWDSPAPKRRRFDSNFTTPSASSPVPSPQKSAIPLVNPAQQLSITSHSTTNTEVKVEIDNNEESNTEQDEPRVVKDEMDAVDFNTEHNEPSFVKVELDDAVEQEERFRRENNYASSDQDPDGDYDGGANIDRDPGGYYGSDLSKTEDEQEYDDNNTSFPGPSLQQSLETTFRTVKISKRAADFPMDNSEKMKRKRLSLSIAQKVELLQKLDYGVSVKRLSQDYGVGKATVYDLKKQKFQILKTYYESDNKKLMKDRKTLHKPRNKELDQVLIEWFRLRRGEGMLMTGDILKAQARKFHEELKIEGNCDYSYGWLLRFKKRHGINIYDCSNKIVPLSSKV